MMDNTSKGRAPLLCRLKVSGPYYSDFKGDATALTASAAAKTARSAAAADNTGQQAAAALSADAIRSRVEAAVAAVMGAVPSAGEPLVEAGLDSLGVPLTWAVHTMLQLIETGMEFSELCCYGIAVAQDRPLVPRSFM